MQSERWHVAQSSGALNLPGGRSLVLGAQPDQDFSGFDALSVVTGHYPSHIALQRQGLDVSTKPEGIYSLALVLIGKSKPRNLAMIEVALSRLEPGGLLLVDGAKTLGIDSLLKRLRQLFAVKGTLSKAHGKLFWIERPATLPEPISDWRLKETEIQGGYLTAPGMFSADGPDPGSELLVALTPALKGAVADFGAGWGYLSAELLAEHPDIQIMSLLEADHAALEAAKTNVTDERARFFWADATDFHPEEAFDAVVSNPPFHMGRAAEPELGRRFILSAAASLKPSGRFFMVANRHLPYEAALKEAFGTGRVLAEMHGYKLFEAAKPKRSRS